jgi:hypothetical protein
MPPPHLPVEAESKSRRLLFIVTVEDDADVCPKVWDQRQLIRRYEHNDGLDQVWAQVRMQNQ